MKPTIIFETAYHDDLNPARGTVLGFIAGGLAWIVSGGVLALALQWAVS